MKDTDLTPMLKDMFDYCYTYDTAIKSILEKDFNMFMQNAGKQLDAIVKAQSSGQFKESANVWEESSYFSSIYETYVTEGRSVEDIQKQIDAENAKGNNKDLNVIQTLNKELNDAKKQQGNSQTSGGTSTGTSGGTGGSNPPKPGGTNGQPQQNNGAQSSDANKDNAKLNVDTSKMQNADELKQLSTAVQSYVNIGQGYLTNRMTAAEGAYKDYLNIMKNHVKDIVGNQNPAQQTAGSTKTDNTKTNDNKTGDGSQNPQPNPFNQ
jgi:hypothetical protein